MGMNKNKKRKKKKKKKKKKRKQKTNGIVKNNKIFGNKILKDGIGQIFG